MTASIVTVVVVASLLSMALAIARVLRGPTQADRVVALDVVFSCSVALTAAAAVVEGSPLFLDVAIGLALVGFVATILWARLLEQSPHEPSEQEEDGDA